MVTRFLTILIFFFMLMVIILTTFFPEKSHDLFDYFNQSLYNKITNSTLENTDSQTKESLQSIKDKIPFKIKILLTIGVCLVTVLFFIMFNKNNKEEQKKYDNDQPSPAKFFITNPTPRKKDYDYDTKTTTEKELEKLKKNPKFLTMLNEKGTDPANWVWQTREKQARGVWREDDDLDDEVE